MADIPRLNKVIGVLEKGGIAFSAFVPATTQSAVQFAQTRYDGIVLEMEHLPWDGPTLRDCLQYMLLRGPILSGGTLAPSVVPFVRIPVNGVEMAQWHAKQALDMGCYGVVWPHISTVDEAYNAVAACRYPRLPDKPNYEPRGIRGDGPAGATRYWGISQQEYYARADVWPLDPNGEIFVIIQIEDQEGLRNLPEMLKNVPGIGAVLIGEGDFGQELGFPRQYDHPLLLEAIDELVAVCREHGVVAGHPHANAGNMQALVDQGFRFLMTGPTVSYPGLEKGLEVAGRD